jgi:hypothetical protein
VKLRFYGQRALLLRKEIACSNVLLSKRVHPRLLIHVRPNGFHRIRHCGLFASANRAETIARAREVLGMAAPVAEEKVEIDPAPAQVLASPCPCCGGGMFIIGTFEAGCAPRHGRPK